MIPPLSVCGGMKIGIALSSIGTSLSVVTVLRHILSAAMLQPTLCAITSIVHPCSASSPLQDWLATDENIRLADASKERINIPANPKHYWRYRMHITLEQLMKQTDFNNSLRNMISQSRP